MPDSIKGKPLNEQSDADIRAGMAACAVIGTIIVAAVWMTGFSAWYRLIPTLFIAGATGMWWRTGLRELARRRTLRRAESQNKS